MRIHALLPALIIVAAELAGTARAASDIVQTDLLGTWEEDPGTCEGDNFISYRGDGTFVGYDYEGRWTLNRTVLKTVITQRMGQDEKWRPVKKPAPISTTIVSLTHDRLIERWPNQSLHHLHRCR